MPKREKKHSLGGVGMKKLLLALFVLSLALGSWAWAEEEKPFELEVSVGGSINDYDDAPSRAAEYKSQVDMDSSWYFGGKFRLNTENVLLNLEGNYIEKEDQRYEGSLDFKRLFSFTSSYDRFWHRLDTDYMRNLEAQSVVPLKKTAGGAAVYHESFESTQDYGIRHSFWKNEAVLRLPSLPGITIGFSHRMEERRGFEQAKTLSKCASCHVAAYSKHIEEYTNDYVPYIEARLGQFTFKYQLLYRSFNSGSDVPTHTYLNANNPISGAEGGLPLRLNYDLDNGALPFARTPDSEKWQHLAKVKWDISPYQSLNVNFVYSDIQNEDSDEAEGGQGFLYGDHGKELDVQYAGVSGNWHWRFRPNMALTIKAKYHNMDGDDVSIDLDDRYASTLAHLEDGTFDFERKSAYDEDEYIFGADLSWRMNKQWRFRFAYEMEYTDRDNAEEHHVTEDTTEHQFKVSATWKPKYNLKVKADYKFLYVNDPFAYYHAACPEEAVATTVGGTDFTPKVGNDDWYSYIVYGRRHAELSNQPEYAHDLGLKLDYIFNAKVSTNLYIKYRYAENDNTDGYDWEQDTFSAGINLSFIPSEKIGFNIGYNYLWDQYTSMLCSAIYHG